MREVTEQEREDARKVFPKITERTKFIPVTEKKFPVSVSAKQPSPESGPRDTFIVLIPKEVDGRRFFAWYWEAQDRCYYYVRESLAGHPAGPRGEGNGRKFAQPKRTGRRERVGWK